MGVLRTFDDWEEAERARAWLERSGLTAGPGDTGDGHLALEVPAGQHQRAEDILQAAAGMGHLADLPLSPWWRRAFAWENLAALIGAAVAVLLAWAAWTAADGLIRYLGLGAALVLAAAVVVASSTGLGGFRNRELSGRIWAQVRMRQRVGQGSGLPPVAAPQTPGGIHCGAPAARRISSGHIPCHRCERFVEAGCERCPFCGAPRPGRP
jgi:hypothetical protein